MTDTDLTVCQRCGRQMEYERLPNGGINLTGIDKHIEQYHKKEFEEYAKKRKFEP